MTDPELSAPPFSRAVIDRDAAERDDPTFAGRFDADPSSRVLAVHGDRVLLAERFEGSEPALELRHPTDLPASALRCYLGRDGDTADRTARLRRRLGRARRARVPPAGRGCAPPRRSLAPRPHGLSRRGARARELARQSHPFCPRCGAPTEPVQAGWARRCDREGNLHLPAHRSRGHRARHRRRRPAAARLERAVGAATGSRCSPGSSSRGSRSRPRSCARCARRPGVVVDRVEYLGVQPWPFPRRSCSGSRRGSRPASTPTAATPDGERDPRAALVHAATSSRAARLGDDRCCPGATSIARALIERLVRRPDRRRQSTAADVVTTLRRPARGARRRAAQARRGAARPGVRARRRRHRQDPRDHAPHRPRRRHGRRTRPAGSWRSRSPRRRPASCAPGCARSARAASRRARSTPPRSRSSTTSGRRRRRLRAPRARQQGAPARPRRRRACGSGSTPPTLRDVAAEIEWRKVHAAQHRGSTRAARDARRCRPTLDVDAVRRPAARPTRSSRTSGASSTSRTCCSRPRA